MKDIVNKPFYKLEIIKDTSLGRMAIRPLSLGGWGE